MDQELKSRLVALNRQNDILKEAELIYLDLEANKKMLLARLTLQAGQGETKRSFAEREAMALSSQEWKDFVQGLVQAESDYQYQRRRYEICDKAYLAEHATFNREAKLIQRQGVVT